MVFIFLLGGLKKVLKSHCASEMCRFPAVVYACARVPHRVVKLWRENLSKVNQKAAESLADPTEYENLFPGLKEAFVAEHFLRETCLGKTRPATDYPLVTVRPVTLQTDSFHRAVANNGQVSLTLAVHILSF